ncbi:YciI family protein [Qipengyuania nanhaisediminis]|uniref:YciI family protein n=1 Tax=Qipengyuania nanhaisediminis TaxID=604088 RepID=UPI0038B40BA3
MALFCFYCRDGENSDTLREVHKQAQREFMAEHEENYRAAGPLTNARGDFVGSLLIIEAEDEAAARATVNDDPYLTGGVWQSIRVDRFHPVRGRWKEDGSEV